MDMSAVDDPQISLSPESWQNSFGLSNSIDTPLGKVKMGEGQYQKLVDKKRSAEFGMVVQTLQDPDVVFIEPSEAKEGQTTERDFSYVFVKTFIRDGNKFKYYTSVSVLKDGMEVSVSSHIASKTAIMKKLQGMERAYTKQSLLPNSSEWHLAEHPTDVPDLLPTQGKSDANIETSGKTVSDRKVNNSASEKQGSCQESSLQPSDNKREQTVQTAVEAASAQVNTEPTEAQKAAGNYKMEHRRVDGYNISIENAKGSVRRGTGADGKPWETTMQNDYGYIRGTEGVDGDHIDVFLSDTPEDGDVFVVDQVNEDGSFDEHKVMYGFPTEQAARDAYLSNYEPGWTGLGAITHVSKDEIKKWIQSGRRKTKSFAEYKSVKAIEGNGMIGRSLTEQEATELIARMKAAAEVAPSTELTPENWIAQFGEGGIVETPVGIVKMGANQLLKLYSLKRTEYFSMIHPTLNTPDVIIEKNAPAEGAERDSKYLFVKTFIKPDGSRLVHFESVTVQRDGMEVSISSHEAEGKAIKKEMQNGKILHLSESLSPSSERYLTEAPSESGGPDLVPTSDNVISSDRKVNTLSADKQTESAESSEPYTITATTYTNKKGKTSDIHLVKFNRELTAEEKTALDTFAREPLTEGKKTSRGWYDRKQGGYMMRSEEAARQLAEMIGNEEAVADAQPMTTEELREAVAPAAPVDKKPARKPKK